MERYVWVLKKAQNFDIWRQGRGFSGKGRGQTQGQEDILLGE